MKLNLLMRYYCFALVTIFLIPCVHAENVYVRRVIDGDTFEDVNGTKYRLVGVDTPETKHPTKGKEPFGEEAYQTTKSMIEGKTVTLFRDRRSRKTDKYGRELVIVQIGEIRLNEFLVFSGLATVMTDYPIESAYENQLLLYQSMAKNERRGIWGVHQPQFSDSLIHSKIISDFDGTEYGNIYQLANGQIWQQTDTWIWIWIWIYPKVDIWKVGNSYKMKIENIDHPITVVRLK